MIGWCEQQRQLSAERQKALDAAAREAARLAEERKRLADEAEAKRALMEKRAAEEAAKYVGYIGLVKSFAAFVSVQAAAY